MAKKVNIWIHNQWILLCVSLCVFVCTHRHWALEMLEGNAVTPNMTWQDRHEVCLAKLGWNPGLMSISEPRAEAAAVFIVTISSIISVITNITSVCQGPQSGFTFLVCLLFVSFTLILSLVHAPHLIWTLLPVCPLGGSAPGQLERNVRCFGVFCHAVVNAGGVWKAHGSMRM